MRKFVQGYGKIARVLTDLLKKDSFKWIDEATVAFHQLQRVVTQVPVLRPPDFSKKITIETNASGQKVGAVLMREGRHTAYFSQVLDSILTGKGDWVADALSRRVEEVELKLTSVTTVGLPDQLLQDLKKDFKLEALRLRLETDTEGMEGYSSLDGKIRYQGRVVLPRTSEWIPRIFVEFHEGAIGGRVTRVLRKPITGWPGNFIGLGLPRSADYSVIMVVVDRLSTSAHFVPIKHPFTASPVATVFISEIVRLHGISCSIISDHDKIFIDGQSKVVNRSLETYLCCFAFERPKDWVKWLPRDQPRLVSYDRRTTVTAEVDQYLWERDRVLAELRARYNREKMKLQRMVAYRLRLPLTSSIHPVFYVSQLKRVVGDHQVVCDLPDGLVTESLLVPAEVCGLCLNAGCHEVLIAWKDMPESEATWEGFEEMRGQFPDFHLEDKVSFRGGSDDANPNH
nr:hypothetical protein [Tanacetum cinerariifolium]GEW92870.1 hypothetical protein [Tanacetum cinerariifolium]